MFEDLEKTFSTKVENRVLNTRCGYMEAVNLLCEEMEIYYPASLNFSQMRLDIGSVSITLQLSTQN